MTEVNKLPQEETKVEKTEKVSVIRQKVICELKNHILGTDR